MNLDIWPAVFALEFDIAAITGDVIVSAADEISPHMPAITQLCKRCPVFYVQGNHELLCFEEIKKTLESAGVIVLNNEKKVWKVKGFGPLPIIGLRDYTEYKLGRFPETNALLRAHSGRFHLILSHQPQIFTQLQRLQLGLVLAGHTHGGQVRLPLAPVLYAPGQGVFPPYGDGWFDDGKNKMYISSGIGTTMFPIRLFNRPEITVLELTNASTQS
jgi:predicted MPP superfamily phosphohydrolase